MMLVLTSAFTGQLKACKKVWRTFNAPTIEYFNTNIANGWHLFLSTKWDDLQTVGFNNATNAFWRTGLFPYNPLSAAWTDAIETISQAQPISGAAHEVFPNKDLPQLSESESNTLHNGLDYDLDLKLHDIAIACIWSTHILGQWRDEIQTAVNEGEDYVQYSNILLPSAKTDAEKIAMRLIHFKKIETKCLYLPHEGT